MGLFSKLRTVKNRLVSLEEHVGAVYVRKDGYAEHQADSEPWLQTIERRLRNVEEFVKANEKKAKK